MAASMTLGQQVTVGGGVGIGGGANAPPPPILRNGFAKGLGVGIGGGVGAALTKGRREGGAWSGGVRSSMATLAIPKPNRDLLSEFEKRWQRAVDNPLEGVPFTYEDFRGALSKYDFNFEIGDTVKGTVFMTESNGALVDIGAKAPAFLPTIEASLHKVKHVLEVGISSGIVEEFQIIREDDNNGRMILSLRKAQYDMAWERCKQLMEEDVIVKGKVVAANRGGVVVNVEGIRGFVPFSQLAARVVTPEELLDKVLPLKFIEVDEEQARLVLSNRKALIDNQRTVAIGSVVEGIVQSVKPYGAFIDIGGINGLLHVSQISHERVSNVETVLSEGDKLKVMILSHDKDRGRISLSTKKLEPTPGDMLRNPALVYEKAEEMAQTFRQRVAIAEAAARAEELRLQREGAFGLRSSTAFGGEGTFKLDESPLAVQSSAKDQGLGFN